MRQHLKLPASHAAACRRCSRPPALADGETIAVFTKNQTNPYFQTCGSAPRPRPKRSNAKIAALHPDQAGQHPRAAQPGRGRDRQEAERHRLHAGRLQGDGAGRGEDQRRQDPGRQHHRPHRRRQVRRLRRRRRLQPRPRNRAPPAQDAWAARATSSSSRASRARSPISTACAASTTR